MGDELADAFNFAASDTDSDIVVLTGAGRAFCAGGDIGYLARNAAEYKLFDHEAGREAHRVRHARSG